MDLNLLSVLLAIIALFLFLPLTFLLIMNKSHSSIPSSMLPPGRTGWPILEENLEFLNTGRQGIPEKFIKDRMEKFSSQIFRTSLLGEAAAVMCGPLGNKFLFTNENKLVTLWWPTSVYKIFPSSAQSSSNQESMKMRKILQEFLKTEALQMYVGIMDSLAKRELKDHWDKQKQVTVFPLSKSYTFSLACKLFMSIEDPILISKLSDPFSVLASGVVSIPIDLPGTRFNQGIKASYLIRKRLREIIKQRKKDLAEGNSSSTQDILSHMLLTADESGQLMEEHDIADKIVGLLIAGHDTASAAITFVVNYLAELPHVYDEVRKEQMKILIAKAPGDPLNWEDIQKMKYSWRVVCEAMRLAPPLRGSFSEALTDFSYNGFSVPNGWKLYWSAYSTHKNPIYFPEPEKFDPSRFEGNGPAPFTYVPFRGGPRICPGKEYARLEILVFMYNVVTKFKWEKLLRDEKMVVNPLPMPANGLPVRLEPHIY